MAGQLPTVVSTEVAQRQLPNGVDVLGGEHGSRHAGKLATPGVGLFHFDDELETHVYTDFSSYGIAAVLPRNST